MLAKEIEKCKAVALRRQGFTYGEILERVPVSKASLSLWLKGIEINDATKQRIAQKRRLAQQKAAQACHNKKILITKQIIEQAEREIVKINKHELLLIGAALYWAEGTKERSRGTSTILGNSDPKLVKIVLKWLNDCCCVERERIDLSIYVHETAKDRIREIKEYWANVTNFTAADIQKVIWKKNKINSKRKNNGQNYFGLLRITVKKSINLNRKIQGWINGIYNNCGVV